MRTLISYLDEFPLRGEKTCLFYKTPYRTYATSYGTLFSLALRLAGYFESVGLEKGERVVLWGNNSPHWVACFLGCLLKGLVVVPMDIRGSASFVERVFQFVDASLVICDPAKIKELAPLRPTSFEGLAKESEKFHSWKGDLPRIEPSDIAEMIFTSGTTADPKGVVLTHDNIVSNVETLRDSIRQGLDENEKWLSLLPLSHIFEQTIGLWLPLSMGYPVTYLKVLKASSIFQALEEERITLVPMVPRILNLMRDGILREVRRQGKEKAFHFLLRLSDSIPRRSRRFLFPALKKKLGKLKYFVAGGATLDRELEAFWERVGVSILQGYGLTETSPVISCNTPGFWRLGSIGKALPGVEVKLSLEKEIWVRGRSVFSGYYRNPEKTREVFEEGWFKTGDVGEFDQDGFLFFRGRKKEIIVTPEGLNVYPEDIEKALHGIRGVKESCVLGVKEKDRELIHAVLLLEDMALDPKDVVRQANRQLQDHQRIQSFSLWPKEDFPRTSTMKVKKNEVLLALNVESAFAEQEGTGVPSRLYCLIAQLARLRVEEIHPGSRLGDDLGLSSLDRVELAAMIEEEFHFDMDDALVGLDTSVHEIEELVKIKKGTREEEKIERWPVHPCAARARESLQRFLLFPTLRLFCRIKVEGVEELRTLSGPAIFVANHTSYFDTPVILKALPPAVRRKVAVATWKEFFDAPRSKPLLRIGRRFEFFFASLGLNIYLFPQQKGFKKSIEHTGWLMDRGFNILFFPEGMRTLTGVMGDFRAGIGMLASSMNVPVIPVGLKGLFEVFPPQRNFPRRGPVTCRFGKALTFSGETHIQIAKRLQAEVERLIR